MKTDVSHDWQIARLSIRAGINGDFAADDR